MDGSIEEANVENNKKNIKQLLICHGTHTYVPIVSI